MKKTVISLFITLLMLALPFCAYAEGDVLGYKDEEMQISFTMPAGWSRFEAPEGSGIKQAFQKNSSEKGTYYSYIVVDLFDGITDEQRASVKRSDFNNSTLTVEEFKTLVQDNYSEKEGITNLTVEAVTVGENSFFKLSFNQEYDTGDVAKVINYCHLYDGYMTHFRYETFEDMLDEAEPQSIAESIVFDNEKGSNKTETKKQKIVKTAGKGALKGGARIIIYALIGMITGGASLIFRKKHAKNEVPLNENQNNTYSAPTDKE